MTYYDRNLEAIKNSKEYLYKKLSEYPTDQIRGEIEEIQLLPTVDGDTAIQIRKNSEVFRFNSFYSPTHEADRWIKQFDTRNIGIVVSMFGLGNGIFVREMIRKLNGRGMLFIYEPSMQIFDFILRNYDITDIIDTQSISITVEGINDNEIKNLLGNYVDWLNLNSQIACIHPQYDAVFQDSLQKFHNILQENIDRAVVNKNTDISMCKLIIDNILINLKLLKNCNIVTDFIGKFPKEVPAIIVAAGPSLDKNIEDIRLAKGKAVIFAVDTAVKYLLARDIEPDFIVTLDPKKSLHHLVDPRCKDIPIFCRADSRPENIEINEKRVILFNLEGYVKSIYERLDIYTGEIRSGGSVATGAFSLCEVIGFQRIILVGQDLAYSGNITHAGGVITDVSNAGSDTRIVEDIYGNPILTRYDWYIYIRWFEDAVDQFSGEEVIDATEGGAKIHGTSIMTFKEAIHKYCTTFVDCEKILSDLKPTFNKEQLMLVKRNMEQDIKDLKEMKPKITEALELCDKLMTKYEKSLEDTNSSKLKNERISQINREVEEKLVYTLLDWDISDDTSEQLYDLYQYTQDEKKDKLLTYQHAKTIYNAIISSIERILPKIEEGYRTLSIDEEK